MTADFHPTYKVVPLSPAIKPYAACFQPRRHNWFYLLDVSRLQWAGCIDDMYEQKPCTTISPTSTGVNKIIWDLKASNILQTRWRQKWTYKCPSVCCLLTVGMYPVQQWLRFIQYVQAWRQPHKPDGNNAYCLACLAFSEDMDQGIASMVLQLFNHQRLRSDYYDHMSGSKTTWHQDWFTVIWPPAAALAGQQAMISPERYIYMNPGSAL